MRIPGTGALYKRGVTQSVTHYLSMAARRKGRTGRKGRKGRRIKQLGSYAAAGAMFRAGGTRKRPRTATRTSRRVRRRFGSRRKSNTESGGYQQFTTESKLTGRRIGEVLRNKLMMRSAKESVIFSFRAVKNFDDNGAKFLRHAYNATDRSIPCYALLLNGRQFAEETGVKPLRSLWANASAGADDGRLYWATETGNDPTTGALTRETLVTEYTPTHMTTFSGVGGGQKLFWDWTELKLNLWGAKNKAIKFCIQIVKVMEDEVSPMYNASAALINTAAQQAWEEQVKQFTYNPIVQINYEQRKKIKVLKTWNRIIQPTSTTENDADPHCHVLKWFSRWNRNVNYDQVVLSDFPESTSRYPHTVDDADFANAKFYVDQFQRPASQLPRGTEQVFLVIRASDYDPKPFEGVSNSTCGSFDVLMRSKFSVLE